MAFLLFLEWLPSDATAFTRIRRRLAEMAASISIMTTLGALASTGDDRSTQTVYAASLPSESPPKSLTLMGHGLCGQGRGLPPKSICANLEFARSVIWRISA
jgi:hypothetical protein